MKSIGVIIFLLVVTGCQKDSHRGVVEPVRTVTFIEIDPDSSDIYVGHTLQYIATIKDQNGEPMADVIVRWNSSNDSIATIDSNGLVTGLTAGTVTITATADLLSKAGILNILPLVLPTDFPSDFPVQYDHLTGNELDGWGGGFVKINKTPIIFIHGNGHTANNWIELANALLDSGYIPPELWALSYLDFSGGDSANSNMANLPDIENFVADILEYTSAEKVDIISHSLGVTVCRAWMKKYNRYGDVNHFIGIAGPNHGVAFCNYDTISIICRELGHPQSEFLSWLNKPDETPFDETLKYMTIYDGTGVDFFYLPSTVMNDGSIHDLRNSPVLEGADNFQIPGVSHFALPSHPDAVNAMFRFLTK